MVGRVVVEPHKFPAGCVATCRPLAAAMVPVLVPVLAEMSAAMASVAAIVAAILADLGAAMVAPAVPGILLADRGYFGAREWVDGVAAARGPTKDNTERVREIETFGSRADAVVGAD